MACTCLYTLSSPGMMGYVAPSVEVTIPDDDWLNVDKLDLRWDPRAVTWRDVDFIDILLYGYREFATTVSLYAYMLRVMCDPFNQDLSPKC